MNSLRAEASSHCIAGIKTKKKKLATICKCLVYKQMETADWNVLKSSLEFHIKVQCDIEIDSQNARCVNKKKKVGELFTIF